MQNFQNLTANSRTNDENNNLHESQNSLKYYEIRRAVHKQCRQTEYYWSFDLFHYFYQFFVTAQLEKNSLFRFEIL